MEYSILVHGFVLESFGIPDLFKHGLLSLHNLLALLPHLCNTKIFSVYLLVLNQNIH
jgi:hypothetical protein